MTSDPSPLVPPGVDLTDFEFMPLDVRRVRDSRFAATSSGEGFRAGFLLWCASWHQAPAASIPDDDVELAQLAGFGRVLREWKKVRAEALHGWVKCSDGRLYHPVVAEKALEAWESKLRHAWQRECDRLRKENKRRKEKGLAEVDLPTFDLWKSGGLADGIPAENALKGQGQGYNSLPSVESAARADGIPPDSPVTWPTPSHPPPWAFYEAEVRGLSSALVPEVYTRWRDLRMAKGMTPVDPVADWRAWCSEEVKRRRSQAPPAGAPPGESLAERARRITEATERRMAREARR